MVRVEAKVCVRGEFNNRRETYTVTHTHEQEFQSIEEAFGNLLEVRKTVCEKLQQDEVIIWRVLKIVEEENNEERS